MKIAAGSSFLLLLLVGKSLALAPVSRTTSSSPAILGQSSGSETYESAFLPVAEERDVILAFQDGTAAAAVEPTSTGTPLQQFSEGYSRLTKEHYLPMAFLQAGFLASSADIATQLMQASTTPSAAGLDVGHVAAMAMVASTMSGAMNAVWLKQLESAFPGKGNKEVFAKTMIHAVILASIINSAYLVGVPLFTNIAHAADPFVYAARNIHGIQDVFAGWKLDEFITLTKLEVLMFIPYNTLAFKFVPPSIRPLTHASISATFNVAVSAITLGIFGTWCDHAMHIFTR